MVLNIYFKLSGIILKLFYKLIYRERFSFGKKLSFRSGFKIILGDQGSVRIGNYCFFNYNCTITSMGKISIGDDCVIGENVKFYDHNHTYKNTNEKIRHQGFNIGEIEIEDNCWIGSNVTILNNVKIGANSVIGANSLIYKSIPENSIVKNRVDLEILNYNEF